MALVRCKNGHMFSARRYGTICPYCQMNTVNDEKAAQLAGEEFDVDASLMTEVANPVCGWLVCVIGPTQGRDYKIRAGKNFVGRADDMDIQILGDNGISRRNHAILVYDPKKKNTMLLPGDAAGIAYLDGEPVYTPEELYPYATIEMGQSKFLFLPFCGDNFNWADVGRELLCM